MKKAYHLKQLYLNSFRNRSRASAINSLKSLPGVVEIRDVVDCIKRIYTTIPTDIEGILYPKTLDEICNKPSKFFRPSSIIEELNWVLAYMRGHWDTLEWFSNKKIDFENYFLLGDYTQCHSLLNEIKDKIGVSLWYYEAKSLLFEYEGKSKDGLTYISEILHECSNNNNYLLSLLYNLYERCHKRVSPFKYDEDLNALYKRNRTELHEDYYQYVLYRLNYYNQYQNTDLSLPIMFESLSALVDRYLMVVSIIKSALIQIPDDTIIRSKGCYLYGKTKDRALISVMALGNRKIDNYVNESIIRMLDSYYSGNYSQCKEESVKLIISNPTCCFDACIFYVRSLVYLKKNFSIPFIEHPDAPVNILCSRIYNVLTFKNAHDNLYSLYQINKNLYSFQIASAIDNFYKIESNEKVDVHQKLMGLTYFDPLFSRMWENSDEAVSYIERYENSVDSSLACQVWKKRINHEKVNTQNLPLHVVEPINAEHYYKEGKYEEAFNHAKTLYQSATDFVPIRQTAVAKMIDCLFQDGKVQKAITHYADYYVKDLASVAKVDTTSIIRFLQDNLYEGIRRNVDLLIFVALTCNDSVDKSFVLLELCEIKNVRYPSGLIDVLPIQEYGKEKLELLFSLLNDDEILKHYSTIDSFKDRLSERKKILQYIISLNTDKKELYQEQLKKVEDALLVYNLSKNMDESKIYANEEAIINYKLSEIDGLYSRYRMLVDTIVQQRKNIFVVNFDNSLFFDNEAGYEEDQKTQIAVKNNGLYEVFNNLYSEIREQFLYSDYGLVAYLSTRVRHGELESLLRPEMAQRNLILQIRDDIYVNDIFWSNTYNLNRTERTVVNDALVKFSTEFDNAITFLIKQKLQIYDFKEKPEGLFKYDVEEKEAAIKAMEIGLTLVMNNDSKEHFIQSIFTWLWEKIEASLESIRQYIDHEFTKEILSSISTLESTIKDYLPDGHARDGMLSQIRSATEAISLKIQKVSKWFYVSHPKLEDVDFKVISHQVYNAVKYSNTNSETDDQLSIKGDTFKIKSVYVMHYADILRNVITNMFNHSIDAQDGKRHFGLDINIEQDKVCFSFVNDTSQDPEELNAIIKRKLSGTASALGEGGSGIAKVKKILTRDLNCAKNTICMKAEQGKCITNVTIYLDKFKV